MQTQGSDQRIRMVSKAEAPADLAGLYDRADAALGEGELPGPTLFGNQIRALAHHPELLRALIGVYEAFGSRHRWSGSSWSWGS